MKIMKKMLTAMLCCAMAFTLAACGSSDSSDTVDVVLMSENPEMSLDSSQATDGTSFEIINAFKEGLYTYDADGELVLGLADSVEVSDDKLTYTFTLKDTTWSNGTAVTANDFVYAVHYAIEGASEYAFLFGELGANLVNGDAAVAGEVDVSEVGITAIDDKTVQFQLATPCGFFEKLLAFPTFFPINQEFAESCGDQYATSINNLIYCGPFTLTSWDSQSQVVLTKNENYYDADVVQVDTLTINLAQDQSAAALQFDSGELDYCIISSSLVDNYSDSEDYSTLKNGFLWYLYVNFENEYLANENIRKGLSAAINRADLCDNILKDGSTVATGFVPSGLTNNTDGTDFAEACGDLLAANDIDYDLEAAQAYIDAGLEELGVDSITIDMVYGTNEGVDTTATYLEQAFNALDGVTLELVATQKKSRIDDYQKNGNFDLALTRWGPDFADSTTYLNNMVKVQWGVEETDVGNNNYGHYYNAEYDALLESARNEADTTTRESYLMEANNVLMEDVAIIPLFEQSSAVLTSSSLSGLVHNPAGTPYIYKYLTKS
ncbi:MAG: peptide ABC transporter substrate-binding protein [Erysipelotrichaceae bacterium]|nr:peptide ABC transporter substrate-binding protein [Erysipelotrichaceae bacterium]